MTPSQIEGIIKKLHDRGIVLNRYDLIIACDEPGESIAELIGKSGTFKTVRDVELFALAKAAGFTEEEVNDGEFDGFLDHVREQSPFYVFEAPPSMDDSETERVIAFKIAEN